MSRPDDPVLWARELQRIESLRGSYAKRGNPDADVTLGIAVANVDQLRGIALRHLKRYPEAIAALSESSTRLQKTWTLAGCAQPSPPARCAELDDLRALTASLEANVRRDQNDPDGMGRALGSSVAFSRRTSTYRERLNAAVAGLFGLQAFKPGGALLLAEMKAAIDERDNPRLLSIVAAADAAYGRMFTAVSWNLQTRKMRENDPRDFVDNTGIGIGRRQKYGMTDPDEDHATFVTVMVEEELFIDQQQGAPSPERIKRGGYASADDYLKNIRITDYVRAEMAAGNFEPVVKYLNQAWMFGTLSSSQGLVCLDPPPKIRFDEVARRLRIAPAGTVSPVTVEVFSALDEASRFVAGHCHARPRR